MRVDGASGFLPRSGRFDCERSQRVSLKCLIPLFSFPLFELGTGCISVIFLMERGLARVKKKEKEY